MADLKPCPFCGSTVIYETYTEEYSGTKNPVIFCNSCKAIFSIEDDSPFVTVNEDYKYRKEKTKEAWNIRAQPEIIRCKDCKHSEHWYRDKRRCFLWAEDGIDVFDDGFCNYAERRTDAETKV